MRHTIRAALLAVPLLTALFSAVAAEPAASAASADEPLDVLRQRLAEKLSTKEAAGPMKVTGTGRGKFEAEPAKARRVLLDPSHWSYAGEGGPEHWAELSPDNKLCASGTRQSPIDIRDTIKVDLAKIQFDYKPTGFAVLDNGHTVQVNLSPGNGLDVMGRHYELVQFHFHRPSEERVNGQQYDMVAHLVHRDAEGHLAVLAVLLARGPDRSPQPIVQTIWNNLPLEKMSPLPAPGTLDMNQLLPEDRSYFTFMGSLTEPPCTEEVLWMVMRQPVLLTSAQIAIFEKLYPMNARPIQPTAGRLIKESQ